jgi:indolepyruvate ferredoxin oxidoreductase beta subunit
MSAPVTLLVAAMGGEGGGVLTDWIMNAARAEDLIIQSTSIPGVAQRTGATTYYIEFLTPGQAAGKRPVMSLYPGVGGVDVMVSTELVEAGRAMQNGFVTPERTTLIASTHRVYSVAEKVAMADDRFDVERILAAAQELAKEPILFDMADAAKQAGSVINAVILGVVAGSKRLPISVAAFEEAIRKEGKSVDSSLAAFHAGLERVSAGSVIAPATGFGKRPPLQDMPAADSLYDRVEQYSEDLQVILREGLNRQIDYLDHAYGALYLDRFETIAAAEAEFGTDGQLSRSVAKYLAVRMSFEDVIRVADIKTRPERLARIREELGAKPGEAVIVTDYLKPGVEEMCSVLPAFIGGPIQRWADGSDLAAKLHVGLHIKTTSFFGYRLMRAMAGLKRWRRRGHRYQQEQQSIETWLTAIREALAMEPKLAIEIAECARLIKGYSDTHRRAIGSYSSIMETLVVPALKGEMAAKETAAAIIRARSAALSDASGASLQSELSQP